MSPRDERFQYIVVRWGGERRASRLVTWVCPSCGATLARDAALVNMVRCPGDHMVWMREVEDDAEMTP